MAMAVHELSTPDHCVMTLIYDQPQMLFGVAANTGSLAKAARLFRPRTWRRGSAWRSSVPHRTGATR